jgi:hypothetical protein
VRAPLNPTTTKLIVLVGRIKSVDEFVTIRYPNIGNVKLTVDVLEGLVKGFDRIATLGCVQLGIRVSRCHDI